jgi:hypothetical protein
MNLSIDEYKIPLEVMGTPDKREIGMMGRTELDGGMLSDFPDVQERGFWMKNCLIPLDIVFLIDNEITKIHRNVPPCDEYVCNSYTGVANLVLELNGDELPQQTKVGDKLKFTK